MVCNFDILFLIFDIVPMTLLLFLIIISILVFVHELGHFLVAKWKGIKVEEFGLGFPPRIFAKKRGETTYSINALPIGGFVRLYGEGESVGKERARSFYHKSRLVRAGVTVAGVVMNFLLAVLVFSILSWVSGVPVETGRVRVLEVAPGSPAQEAGLEKNDVLLGANGQKFSQTREFTEFINLKRGQETGIEIEKEDGGRQLVKVVPRENPPHGEGALGVIVSSAQLVKPPLWQRPFISVLEGTKEAVFWAGTTAVGLWGALSQTVRGVPPEGIAGPVGIFQITGGVARSGFLATLSFLGILSVNLAILNITPFPALDGGRLLFIVVEAVFGRRVLPTFERWAHMVGMFILIALIILVTFRDITRLFSGIPLVP